MTCACGAVWDHGDEPAGPCQWGASEFIAAPTGPEKYQDADALRAEVIRLRAEAKEEEALRGRLTSLLRGVANGLKGPPPDLVSWDWSDLPNLSKTYRTLYEAAAASESWPPWRHAEQCSSYKALDRRPDVRLGGRCPCDCGLDAFLSARRAVAEALTRRS